MAITHGAATRTALATAIRDAAGGGTLVVLDGSTVLTEHDLPTPAGTVSGAVLTLGNVADATVQASGEPDGFEVRGSGGAVVFEGSVGTTGSGADLEFDTLTWVQGGTVQVGSGTYTASP